jgi:two-component system, OmpR family, response regulator MprA
MSPLRWSCDREVTITVRLREGRTAETMLRNAPERCVREPGRLAVHRPVAWNGGVTDPTAAPEPAGALSQPRVLVVDDEPGILEFVDLGLTQDGFRVIRAASAAAGFELERSERPDLMIIDVGLPDGDGFELLARVRADSDVPVIMLTARGTVEDRVRGLEMGADDYVAKPFHFAELLARVRAHLRRRAADGAVPDVLQAGELTIDRRARQVRRGERQVELTAREFELLDLLARESGTVLSKDSILERLWGYAFDDNLVEVYVGYLRRKLGEPALIHTIRGVGYVLRAEP